MSTIYIVGFFTLENIGYGLTLVAVMRIGIDILVGINQYMLCPIFQFVWIT